MDVFENEPRAVDPWIDDKCPRGDDREGSPHNYVPGTLYSEPTRKDATVFCTRCGRAFYLRPSEPYVPRHEQVLASRN